MKKLFLLTVILIGITSNLYSQKMYVWCQQEQGAIPRPGFLEAKEIDLVIFDTRTLTSKSRVKCESEEIIENMTNLIKQTYPAAKFNVLESEKFYQNPEDNKLTIKIALSAYHAAFGADVKVGIGSSGGNFTWGIFPEGKWNSVAGYSILIYDNEKGENQKFTKEIGKVASRPNTGGYRTAKNILNTAYIEANQELFGFIDRTLME